MYIRTFLCLGAAVVLASAQPNPGVDIAWKVLPRKVASDSFGSRVAKLYYAVVAVVGNNTSYDLQVSSLFFQLPAESGIKAPVPVDPYKVVRGSLEREQQWGLRNTAINLLKGAGPILAGSNVFLAGAIQYSRAINLLSSPLERGAELVFPDKTMAQLASLDTQALRENTIVASGNQQVLLVFISRDILSGGAHSKALDSRFKSDFDPRAVMLALGDIVLVGKSISYVNRITVSSAKK